MISIFRRDDEAAEHYNKALELTPSFIRAMLNKALLHLYRNELVQVRNSNIHLIIRDIVN
jgi:Tfp pilus assembly protein PilF